METLIFVLLGATSIISLTFIIERGLALRPQRVIPAPLHQALQSCRTEADRVQLRAACQYHPSTLARLIQFLLDRPKWGRTELVEALEVRARHEITRLEQGLVFLEIATGIAPLLGLVGTVYGMIALFTALGESGLGDNTAFAKGIGIALRATLMGLLVAIPSLVAWSYYGKRVENYTVELEILCDDYLRRTQDGENGQSAPDPSQTKSSSGLPAH